MAEDHLLVVNAVERMFDNFEKLIDVSQRHIMWHILPFPNTGLHMPSVVMERSKMASLISEFPEFPKN